MIKNKDLKILKRKVKYVRFEVRIDDLRLILPRNENIDVNFLLEKKRNWLERKIKILNEIKSISENLKIYHHQNLEDIINSYIEKYSDILKVKSSKICFRLMKRKWGVCNSQNKLSFNKLLKYLPLNLIEYVVLHEMIHLIVKNHKREFWLLVAKFFPDFTERHKLLNAYMIKLLR